MQAKVVKKELWGKTSFYLKLFVEDFSFKAGQFIIVNFGRDKEGKLIKRAYSIASPTSSLPCIELLIKTKKESRSLPFLSRLGVGEELSISGPFGNFYLQDSKNSFVPIFIAGGTGIAPIRSMLYEWFSKNNSLKPYLLFGSKDSYSLYFFEEFLELKRKGKMKADFFVEEKTISREGLLTGRVTDGIKLLPKEILKKAVSYLCGPSAMVEEGIQELKREGLRESRIFYERF